MRRGKVEGGSAAAHDARGSGIEPVALRNVALTDEQDHRLETLVRCGRCRDADAVAREGPRLAADQEADADLTLDDSRAAVPVGEDDLESGRLIAFESVDGLVSHLGGRTDEWLSGKRHR